MPQEWLHHGDLHAFAIGFQGALTLPPEACFLFSLLFLHRRKNSCQAGETPLLLKRGFSVFGCSFLKLKEN